MTVRGQECMDCTTPSNKRISIVGNILREMPSQGVRINCADTVTVAYNQFVGSFTPVRPHHIHINLL